MKLTPVQYLRRLISYANAPKGPMRARQLQQCAKGLKDYIDTVEARPKDTKAEDLVALQQQLKSLQTTNDNLELRVVDLKEEAADLTIQLASATRELTKERGLIKDLDKRLKDVQSESKPKPKSKRGRSKDSSDSA